MSLWDAQYVLSATNSTRDVESDDFRPQEVVTRGDIRGNRDSVVTAVVLYVSDNLGTVEDS